MIASRRRASSVISCLLATVGLIGLGSCASLGGSGASEVSSLANTTQSTAKTSGNSQTKPIAAASPNGATISQPTSPPSPQRVKPVSIGIEVRESSFGNLTYQLHCLAGFLSCSGRAYKDLWKTKLSWSEEDDKFLEVWREIMEKYDNAQVKFEQPALAHLAFPLGFHGIQLSIKAHLAGLMADDPEMFFRQLDFVMLETDRSKIYEVAKHFWPRFSKWWKAEVQTTCSTFRKQMEAGLREHDLIKFSSNVAAFYESEIPPGTKMVFHALYRPVAESKSTFGTQIEHHALIEFLPGESPTRRLAIVLHEMFHYFFETSRPEARAGFVKNLTERESGGVKAQAAFHLANEALATALGNGLVEKKVAPERFERLLKEPEGFYANAMIDRSAKAVIPLVERALENGIRISDPSFADEYYRLVTTALGDDLGSPINQLRLMAIVHNQNSIKARQALKDAIKANSSWSVSPVGDDGVLQMFLQYPALSGVVMVTNGEVEQLSRFKTILGRDVRPLIRERLKKKSSGILAVAKNSHSRIFFLFGPDVKALEAQALVLAREPRDFIGFK